MMELKASRRPPDRALPVAVMDDPAVDPGILGATVGHLMRMAYEAAYSDFAERLGPGSVRPGDFSLLSVISRNPGITQVSLGRAAGRDKSSVTNALRAMEDAGLIRRERVEGDRRTYASFLTEAGSKFYSEMEQAALLHIERVNAVIGKDRQAVFISVLKDIIREMPGK
jgi:DNA-binding MarR family transcriptional regulator